MDENILETLTKATDTPSSEFEGSDKFDTSEFSQREMEIIRAVAEGLSNKEIAAKLFISEGTVKNHISGILSKTGLSDRTALAVYYLTGKN